jgi:hypothetical protein
MCLTLRKTDSDKPYNQSKYRWKFVAPSTRPNILRAVFANRVYSPIGKWMRAVHDYGCIGQDSDADIGFHVYLTEEDARRGMNKFRFNYPLAKVEVDKFIASGTFHKRKSETWKRMRIVKVIKVTL